MFGKNGKVFGWPDSGFPAAQGPFYCGVGLEEVYGRPLAEAHMDACMKAGLSICGINAEVRLFLTCSCMRSFVSCCDCNA